MARLAKTTTGEDAVREKKLMKRFSAPAMFPQYAEKYLRIVDKDARVVPFRMKRAQARVWAMIQKDLEDDVPVRYYFLKARQLGFSTLIKALEFWWAATHENITGLTTAHDDDSVQTLHMKHDLFYIHLPKDIRPRRRRSNRKELLFSNPDKDPDSGDGGLQSRLTVQSFKNAHAGVSTTMQLLHLSEFARYPAIQTSAQATYSAMKQIVPERPGTMIFIETTAFGPGFPKDYWDGKNSFRKVFVSWCADDEYRSRVALHEDELEEDAGGMYGDELQVREDVVRELKFWYPEHAADEQWYATEALHRMAWRRLKIANDFPDDLQLFRREYPINAQEAWTTSGSMVFDHDKLEAMRQDRIEVDSVGNEVRKPPLASYNFGFSLEGRPILTDARGLGSFRVYEEPDSSAQYVIGCDVAEGVVMQGDRTSIDVLRVPELVQVAKYTGMVPPDDLAGYLYLIGEKYNFAGICIEATGPGLVTVLKLTKELYYPIVYWRFILDEMTGRMVRKHGWSTNKQTRPIMINALRSLVRRGYPKINDLDTLDEMMHFIDDGKKQQAAPGKNDDGCFSMMLAVQQADQDLHLDEMKSDTNVFAEAPHMTGPPIGSWAFYSNQMGEDFRPWASN